MEEESKHLKATVGIVARVKVLVGPCRRRGPRQRTEEKKGESKQELHSWYNLLT